jgi:hypothetical protein
MPIQESCVTMALWAEGQINLHGHQQRKTLVQLLRLVRWVRPIHPHAQCLSNASQAYLPKAHHSPHPPPWSRILGAHTTPHCPSLHFRHVQPKAYCSHLMPCEWSLYGGLGRAYRAYMERLPAAAACSGYIQGRPHSLLTCEPYRLQCSHPWQAAVCPRYNAAQ